MKPVSEITNKIVADVLAHHGWLSLETLPNPDVVVELLFADGTTRFATWIDDGKRGCREAGVYRDNLVPVNWRPIGVA